MPAPRFFLDVDDDGHWYLVPVESREEWESYIDAMNRMVVDGDENELELPEGVAVMEGGFPGLTFTDPEYD